MIYRTFAILLFAFAFSVHAQSVPPKLQSIIRETTAANGHLTKQMHNEFWEEIRRLGTPSEIELMKKTLNVTVLDAHAYQKELWESAKISYQNNRVVKTQRLIELETEGPKTFEQSLAFPKGSANYQQAMSEYRNSMKVGMENSKRLLSAAANHTSMTSAQGQLIQLDINMINAVLENLNRSVIRLGNLFNEKWIAQ